MAPKKNSVTFTSPTPSASSPRRTRSYTSGKRVSTPAVKPPAKKQKKADAVVSKKKNPKKGDDVGPKEGKSTGDVEEEEKQAGSVIIEACKQCNSFKTRAIIVKEGLESAVSGIKVTINPGPPRRGWFEVRRGGEVFISLQEMKRPFKLMKELDMDKVVEDIVKKIKSGE